MPFRLHSLFNLAYQIGFPNCQHRFCLFLTFVARTGRSEDMSSDSSNYRQVDSDLGSLYHMTRYIGKWESKYIRNMGWKVRLLEGKFTPSGAPCSCSDWQKGSTKPERRRWWVLTTRHRHPSTVEQELLGTDLDCSTKLAGSDDICGVLWIDSLDQVQSGEDICENSSDEKIVATIAKHGSGGSSTAVDKDHHKGTKSYLIRYTQNSPDGFICCSSAEFGISGWWLVSFCWGQMGRLYSTLKDGTPVGERKKWEIVGVFFIIFQCSADLSDKGRHGWFLRGGHPSGTSRARFETKGQFQKKVSGQIQQRLSKLSGSNLYCADGVFQQAPGSTKWKESHRSAQWR